MANPYLRFAHPATLFRTPHSRSTFRITSGFWEGTDCCSSSLGRPRLRAIRTFATQRRRRA